MRSNGLHSEHGTRNGNGSKSEAESISFGTWSDSGRRDSVVEEKTWFDPVDSEEVSDCPGGICPVPWAINSEPKEDLVNHPPHYTNGGVECIEAIESQLTAEEFRGYLKGNCAKYLWRCGLKGKQKEDLKKCQWYLERLIETLED